VTVLPDSGLEDGAVLLSESRFAGELGPAGGVRHEARVQTLTPLTVTMTAMPDPVEPGDTTYFTLHINNPWSTQLDEVSVRGYVPAHASIDDDTTTPASVCSVSHSYDICYTGEALVWSPFTLLPDEVVQIQVPAKVNAVPHGSVFTNRVEVLYAGAAMPVEAERSVAVGICQLAEEPEDLTAKLRRGVVYLSWSESDGADFYAVYRSVDNAAFELVSTTADAAYEDRPPADASSAEYYAVAMNDCGEGEASDTVKVVLSRGGGGGKPERVTDDAIPTTRGKKMSFGGNLL
jgi:hypothetical protein